MTDRTTFIHNEAERIRDKIKGCKLFAQPIDMTDIDTLIYAAFEVGKHEAQQIADMHERTMRDFDNYLRKRN